MRNPIICVALLIGIVFLFYQLSNPEHKNYLRLTETFTYTDSEHPDSGPGSLDHDDDAPKITTVCGPETTVYDCANKMHTLISKYDALSDTQKANMKAKIGTALACSKDPSYCTVPQSTLDAMKSLSQFELKKDAEKNSWQYKVMHDIKTGIDDVESAVGDVTSAIKDVF